MAEEPSSAPNLRPLSEPPMDLKSRLKASYDAIAPRYNEWTILHSATRLHYLNQLLERLATNTTTTISISILELGCGCGIPVTQTLLSRPNFSVTANDLSSTQLALARSNLQPDSLSHGNRLTLLEGDMLSLELNPSTFDAVIGMYSLIHLPRGEQVEILRKIAAWLKPGGWFLANFAAQELEGVETQNWLGEEEGWMFWSGWGEKGTVEMMEKVGLEVVARETVEDEVDNVMFMWILGRKRGV